MTFGDQFRDGVLLKTLFPITIGITRLTDPPAIAVRLPLFELAGVPVIIRDGDVLVVRAEGDVMVVSYEPRAVDGPKARPSSSS